MSIDALDVERLAGNLVAIVTTKGGTTMSHSELERGLNWYLNMRYMGGASAAAVTKLHREFYHCFRKLFDAGFIQQPIEPALPELTSDDDDDDDER